MPPQAPTSFIPKKPLDSGQNFHESGGLGFLFFIALFIFIASLVAVGVVFGYKQFLVSSIASKSDSLQKAEGAFDPSTINGLVRMDSRINNANTLLGTHVGPSSLFAFLSQQTLQNVQFTSFSYQLNTNNSATINLSGTADSFSTVALQSDQFGASSMLKDVIFSDIKTVPGSVTFSVTATVDKSMINYGKNLGNAATQPVIQQTQVQTTQTTTTAPPSAAH